MPLAWGAKAYAGTGHRDPFFLQAAEGQGAAVCLDWDSGFLFSWEVTMSHKIMTRFVMVPTRATDDPEARD
jgi:hypothetical protein